MATVAVGDVYNRDVLTTSPTTTLLECAKTMASKHVGSIIIVEGKRVIGMLTEQDIARKVVAQEINPETTSVREVMSVNVITIEPERNIRDAIQLMANNEVKHLPVVHAGALQGIITSKDILKIEPALMELLRA